MKNSKRQEVPCLTSFPLSSLRTSCDSDGYIDWPKLVEFNSGNMKR